MGLVEAANLGFSEQEFLEFFGPTWKKAAFNRKGNETVILNKGVWGYLEDLEMSDDFRTMSGKVLVSYKGSLVWEMYRRCVLGERFLREYDANLVKKGVNLVKQIPLKLRIGDLYRQGSQTETRMESFRGLMHLIAGGRGELGDFSCDAYVLAELDKDKSDTLFTGGITGGLKLA